MKQLPTPTTFCKSCRKIVFDVTRKTLVISWDKQNTGLFWKLLQNSKTCNWYENGISNFKKDHILFQKWQSIQEGGSISSFSKLL